VLCYRSFMKPTDFLDHLLSRFDAQLPENPSLDDIDYFAKKKIPTQKRVVFVLTWWIENHYHDFGLNARLKSELEDFILSHLSNNEKFNRDSLELTWMIMSQTRKYDELINNTKIAERRGKMMESMLLELSPEDLSMQICIHNFNLFKNIHPIEFLNQIWGPPEKFDETSSPSLDFFIQRFDNESYWVCTEIVMVKDLKKRCIVLKTFIHTAKMSRNVKSTTTFLVCLP